MYNKHHHILFFFFGSFNAKDILGLVHIDICGLMTTSHGRTKYFLTFINDFFEEEFFLYREN